MTLKLIYFLYIYFAFLFAWFIFFVISIYHIIKFGFKNFSTFFVSFIFIGVAIILLSISFNFIKEIDWTITTDLFKNKDTFDNVFIEY